MQLGFAGAGTLTSYCTFVVSIEGEGYPQAVAELTDARRQGRGPRSPCPEPAVPPLAPPGAGAMPRKASCCRVFVHPPASQASSGRSGARERGPRGAAASEADPELRSLPLAAPDRR